MAKRMSKGHIFEMNTNSLLSTLPVIGVNPFALLRLPVVHREYATEPSRHPFRQSGTTS